MIEPWNEVYPYRIHMERLISGNFVLQAPLKSRYSVCVRPTPSSRDCTSEEHPSDIYPVYTDLMDKAVNTSTITGYRMISVIEIFHLVRVICFYFQFLLAYTARHVTHTTDGPAWTRHRSQTPKKKTPARVTEVAGSIGCYGRCVIATCNRYVPRRPQIAAQRPVSCP